MSVCSEENGDMIKVTDLCFRYPEGDNYIVNNLSCCLRRGEVTAITGQNGCGKTTLARLLTGVLRPESGNVLITSGKEGMPLDISDMSLSAIGRVVGYVYQDPTRQLFCETVYEEIAYGLRNQRAHEDGTITEEEIDKRVVQAMEYFRLSEKADAYPGTMSQGEKQRVMLAAVMALDTQYVILDEPTSGLDMEGCRRLGELMRDMSARGSGIVIVSHERTFIDEYADREIPFEKINGKPGISRADKSEGNVSDAPGVRTKRPGRSKLAGLDMRSRMFASICIVMLSVFSRDPLCLLCLLAITVLLIGIGGAGVARALYRARGMLGLAFGLFLVQCIFVRSGPALLAIGDFTIVTYDGMSMALVSMLRLMILTFTALIMAEGSMRDAIASLSQMHLPYDIVFMVMAALKFLPFLREESIDVVNASKMRGAFDDMNAKERMRLYLKLVVPVTAGAIRRAEKMNVAMVARGFRAYEKRTRFFSVRMRTCDWIFMAVTAVISLTFVYLF